MSVLSHRELKPFLIGLVGVIVGVLIVMVARHAWNDHAMLHQVVGYLNAASPKINKLP